MTINYSSSLSAENQQQSVNPEREGWKSKSVPLSAWVMDHMVVRTDTYGLYVPGPTRCKKGLTLDDLVLHFAGKKRPIGLYTTEPQHDTGKWTCVEIDNHGDRDPAETWRVAHNIYQRCRDDLGLAPLLEDSNGRGGYHLWFLFDKNVKARLLRALGLWLVKDAPFAIEVFPKQDRVSTTPKQCGNYVRLPGRHHKRDYWSRVWDGRKWLAGRDAAEYVLAFPTLSPDSMPFAALDYVPPKADPLPDPAAKHTYSDPERWLADFQADLKTLDLVGLFEDHNLYVSDLGGGQHAVTCPWADDHTTESKGTCIWVRDDGYPTFHCLHAHCGERMVDGKMVAKRGLKEVCAHFGTELIDAYCTHDYGAAEHEMGERASAKCKEAPEVKKTEPKKGEHLLPDLVSYFAQTPKDYDWIIRNRLRKGVHAILGGKSKGGKTVLCINFITDLLMTGQSLGHEATPCQVLYLDFENDRVYEQQVVLGALGGRTIEDLAASFRMSNTEQDGQHALPEYVTEEYLDRLIVPYQPGLIVIDTVRGGFGLKPDLPENWEDKMSVVGQLLRPLTKWAHRTGWTILSMHHTNHAGRLSGSTELSASVDQVFEFERIKAASGKEEAESKDSRDVVVRLKGRMPMQEPFYLTFDGDKYHYLGGLAEYRTGRQHDIVTFWVDLLADSEQGEIGGTLVAEAKERFKDNRPGENRMRDIIKALLDAKVFRYDSNKYRLGNNWQEAMDGFKMPK